MQFNIKATILALLLFGLIYCDIGKLHLRINQLEDMNSKEKDYYQELAILYIYSEDFQKAYSLFNGIYKMNNDSFYLLNSALVLSLIDPVRANYLWVTYQNLPLKSRSGPRWDNLVETMRKINMNQGVDDHNNFNRILKELYYGKAYYTIILLVNIYHKYHKPDSSFLELRAECYYYSGYYKEAEEQYFDLITNYDSVAARVVLGRMYYKQKRWSELKKCYLEIDNLEYKNANYYYLLGFSYYYTGNAKDYNSTVLKLQKLKKDEKTSKLYNRLKALGEKK